MISKGIFGIGCSFMWGEGLYYYSKLPDVPKKYATHYFDEENIRSTHKAFKNQHRYIQLVSNHFNIWNFTFGDGYSMNGGSNVRSFNDLMVMFNQEYRLTPNHFSLFIFQFTSPLRDTYTDGKVLPNDVQIQSVYDNMKVFRENNVKIVTLSWWKEISNNPLYKKLFSENHCDIEVDGDIRESFDYFIDDDKYNCTLRSDFYPPHLENDIHFNIKGHRCVADSIIKKLKKDKFNPKDYE